MVATPPQWIAASPSDDDDDEDAVRPQELKVAGSKEEIYDLEDDNVEVVNVVKEVLPESRTEPRRSEYYLQRAPTRFGMSGLPKARPMLEFRDSVHLLRPSHTDGEKSLWNEAERLQEIYSSYTELTADSGAQTPQERGLPIGHPLSRFPRSEFSERLVSGEACASGRSLFVADGFCSRERQLELEYINGVPTSQRRSGRTAAEISACQFEEPWVSLPEKLGIVGSQDSNLSRPIHVNLDHYHDVHDPIRGLLEREVRSNSRLTENDMREWWRSWQPRVGTGYSPLHHDIVQFCDHFELKPVDLHHRREALAFVKEAVFKIWPTVDVQVFGSSATGLALRGSDVDIALLTSRSCCIDSWQKVLREQLRELGVCRSLTLILHARIPLLKVVFNSGVACDISMNATNGPRGVPIIRNFMEQYEALRPLCLVLKYFLGLQDMNQVYTGGLSSFCLISLVFSHLRKLGVVGCGNDLGALLVSFFTRYAVVHDYSTDVVSVRSDFYVSKRIKGWVNSKAPDLLSVEDPLDPVNDIAKGSYRIDLVRSLFARAKAILLTHWPEKDVLSYLMTMTRGNSKKRGRHQPVGDLGQETGFLEAGDIGGHPAVGRKRRRENSGRVTVPTKKQINKWKRKEERKALRRARQEDGTDLQRVPKNKKRKRNSSANEDGSGGSKPRTHRFQNKWFRNNQRNSLEGPKTS